MGSMRAHSSQVLGLDQRHLLSIPGCGSAARKLLPLAVNAFIELRFFCAEHGIQLAVASSYRSYEQQLRIWNEKFYGLRPLLDNDGKLIDVASLSDREKVFSILRWSALPGASRHHWGADLDVYDLAALPGGYDLKLVPDEYERGGPFEKLGQFFTQQFAKGDVYGFYRPYMKDRGGVAIEPWHISHRLLAEASSIVLTPKLLREHIAISNVAGKDVVLACFDEIWERFVKEK